MYMALYIYIYIHSPKSLNSATSVITQTSLLHSLGLPETRFNIQYLHPARYSHMSVCNNITYFFWVCWARSYVHRLLQGSNLSIPSFRGTATKHTGLSTTSSQSHDEGWQVQPPGRHLWVDVSTLMVLYSPSLLRVLPIKPPMSSHCGISVLI